MRFTIFITVLFIAFLKNNLQLKDTEWLDNSPTIIHVGTNSAKFCFAVTEPATIYWRVYTNNIISDPKILTNINSLENITSYGGNVTEGNNNAYTNNITNLDSNQEYFLLAIAVSYIGNFPKEIKKIRFKTL